MARSGGEAAVAGDQGCVQRLGQGDIGGIIGGQVVPQRPDPRRQQIVGITPNRQVGQVGERGPAAAPCQDPIATPLALAQDLSEGVQRRFGRAMT